MSIDRPLPDTHPLDGFEIQDGLGCDEIPMIHRDRKGLEEIAKRAGLDPMCAALRALVKDSEGKNVLHLWQAQIQQANYECFTIPLALRCGPPRKIPA